VISEVLKQFAWSFYDNLGGLIVVNVVWALVCLPWLGGAVLIVAWGGDVGGEWSAAIAATSALLAVEFVIFSPPSVLLFLAGRRWARGEVADIRDLLKRLPGFFARAQLLGLTVMGGSLLLLVNAVFYSHRLGGWSGTILSGAMIWFLVALLVSSMYLFPTLISRSDQRQGVGAALRHSLLVAIDNIGLSLGLFTLGVAGMALAVVTGVGVLCGGVAAVALLVSVGFHRILRQYGLADPTEASSPRSWRDLLRPWQM
jgi:uncharacterized membrane protein YesL